MEHIIKEVTKSELEKRAEVICKSFGTVAEQLGLSDDESRSRILNGQKTAEESELEDRMFGVYVKEDGKESMVGSAQIVQSSKDVYDLKKLAVLPQYRHNGFGRELIEYGCELVRNAGGEKLRITIIEANTVLKNWYLKMGFCHVGTQKYTHLPYVIGFMEYTV